METQSRQPQTRLKLKVDVGFDPGQVNPAAAWTFDPDTLPVPKGKTAEIKFQQKPNDPRWDFDTAAVKNGGTQFRVRGNGNNLTIEDDNLVAGDYQYSVTVKLTNGTGTTITSPDPQISNAGPEM